MEIGARGYNSNENPVNVAIGLECETSYVTILQQLWNVRKCRRSNFDNTDDLNSAALKLESLSFMT
jgi:hypothetical protein